jgi:hypothetical protein
MSRNRATDLILENGEASTINGIPTAGQGVPIIVAAPPVGTDLVAASTNFINYKPPAKAGVYLISATVNVTAWTTPASARARSQARQCTSWQEFWLGSSRSGGNA